MPALKTTINGTEVEWYAAGSTPDWLQVHFKSLNFTSNDVEQDDTTTADFAADGALWQSRIKTALGGSFALESIRRSSPILLDSSDDPIYPVDLTEGTTQKVIAGATPYADTGHVLREPAQYRLEQLDRSMGHQSKGWFRLVLLDEGWMWDFKGIVKATPFGGGLTDVMSFRADITIAGPPVFLRIGETTR
jgi:hypothetical protein